MPAREAVLEAFRQRNAVLDYLFYDLGALDPGEASHLAPRYAAEGAILYVPPGRDSLVHLWPDVDAFRASRLDTDAHALVVAGVGSSALGAAAFARNVADATGRPALAVVSGYGLADLLSEAVGGFFLYGWLNGLRQILEPLDDLTRPGTDRLHGLSGAAIGAARASLDVRTLAQLVGHRSFDLLVGHSKGNLVIAEALEILAGSDPARARALAARTHIVTISAKIFMPRPFLRVTDVMGGLDGFGLLNSRPSIPTDVPVAGAWHHTNTELPFHLPVERTLRSVLA